MAKQAFPEPLYEIVVNTPLPAAIKSPAKLKPRTVPEFTLSENDTVNPAASASPPDTSVIDISPGELGWETSN